MSVYAEPLRIPRLVLALLAATAVLGYLLGVRHVSSPSTATFGRGGGVASNADLLLEYPAGWAPASGAPVIPGLAIARAQLLAPTGRGGQAGLISGTLSAAGEPGVLPASFLSGLARSPRTQIVDLIDGQAYRYSGLGMAGAKSLELYVLPSGAGAPAVLACYATAALSVYLRECEQIVARLTLVGQAGANLNPDPVYGERLAAVVAALGRSRYSLRRKMARDASPAALASVARSLSQRFSTAAAALTSLQPPAVAGMAQAALLGATLRARDGYRALAQAAASQSLASYEAAREGVRGDELALERSLADFALLGYGRSGAPG